MKILILSPNQIGRKNWTHQLFRNEFSKHHNVTYYGEGFPNYSSNVSVPEVVKKHGGFDLIMTYGLRYTEPFYGIGDVTNIPKAHIAVDYFPDATGGTWGRNHKLFNRDKYDIYFGVVGRIVNDMKNNGYPNVHLLPFSIDTNIYRKIDLPKDIHIFAVFTKRSDTYPNRDKVHRMLLKNFRNNILYTRKIQHEPYIQTINRSCVCITSNNKFKSLSIKYTEIMSCGSFLLADEPEDLKELGYENHKHLVIYEGLEDLALKIRFYLKHPDLRERIARQGMGLVREFHNNSIRVKQFTEIINRELGVK